MKKLLRLKQFCICLLLLCTTVFGKSQAVSSNDTVTVNAAEHEIPLLANSKFYFHHGSTLNVSEVLKKPFSPFKSRSNKVRISPANINSTLYLQVPLKNAGNEPVHAYLNPGLFFTEYRLYKISNGFITEEDPQNSTNYKKLSLAAGESCLFLLEIKPLKTEMGTISPELIRASYIKEYKQDVSRHKSDLQMFGLVLSGVLFMMILLMLANFVTSHKPEFLYNAAYSACMFTLIFLNSTVVRLSTGFNTFFYSYFDFFLLVTGTIFYIAFARKFLDTKNNYALLDRILKNGKKFVLLLLAAFTLLNFCTDTFLPQYYLANIVKVLFLLLGFAFIYLALKRKDRLFNYLAAGNAMLVLFSSISFLILFFNIKPTRIYFTSLFYYDIGIVLELIFFLLGLAYKNRRELIKEIKKQEAFKLEAEKKEFETQLTIMKAQQEERNRISADMHDDLGAGMTTISLYSELAKSKLVNNTIPEIEKISSAANDLLNKMNAIIWSMNSSNDSLGNMVAYIRSYALEYFEDTGIHCKISIPENLPNIQVIGEIRRNVFLVVKEALNNILKHSKATEVGITLERNENILTLYIQDNGTGINMEKIRQFGNGLKNMKKRMADIKVDFTIENKEGTLITMSRKVNQF